MGGDLLPKKGIHFGNDAEPAGKGTNEVEKLRADPVALVRRILDDKTQLAEKPQQVACGFAIRRYLATGIDPANA